MAHSTRPTRFYIESTMRRLFGSLVSYSENPRRISSYYGSLENICYGASTAFERTGMATKTTNEVQLGDCPASGTSCIPLSQVSGVVAPVWPLKDLRCRSILMRHLFRDVSVGPIGSCKVIFGCEMFDCRWSIFCANRSTLEKKIQLHARTRADWRSLSVRADFDAEARRTNRPADGR